jgi:hypothetical protein
MSRMTLIRFILTLTIAFLMSASGSDAQSVLTGEWTASFDGKSNRIQMNFEHRSERHKRSSMGQNYDFADLQGLTREQASGSGPVRFSLVREAGRVDCEGSFQNGRGSGTFRFTPDLGFVSTMKSRGFDFETGSTDHGTDNKLFAATTLNITTALVDDLNSAGFGKLDVDDLFKAAIFKVDSRFKREMKDSGFGDLGMEDLVKARIFKVDANFMNEAKQMGFESESLEELVKLRIFKVTPEFIAEVRNEGLTSLSLEDAVKLRIFKIDSTFIRRARADGVPIEVEKLVEKKIGVRHRN